MIKRQSVQSGATSQPTTSKRRRGVHIKASTLAMYLGVFVFIVSLVALGYQEPRQTVVAQAESSNGLTLASLFPNNSVDSVLATRIAADVAETANLAIAPSITNLAVSTKIISELTVTNDIALADKPQIIEAVQRNRSIIDYSVARGDTLDSISRRFGVSNQTIRWANNMTNDAVVVGQKMRIPPTNGVIYIVKAGDSASSIARKYGVSADVIVSFNDLEISGPRPNREIIIPGGSLPINERPEYAISLNSPIVRYGWISGGITVINPSKYISIGLYSKSVGNTTFNGQCTWWAWERRKAIGRPLPSGLVLGNAGSWAYNLSGRFVINNTPAPGAIMEDSGHVAIVERVDRNSDGSIKSILISEMNNYVAAPHPTYVANERIIHSYEVYGYTYIH